MRLVDTHAHVCDEAFAADRSRVLERGREAGVVAVIAVSENLAEAERTLELAEEYPDTVHPAVGLFPTVLDLEQAASVERLIRAETERLVAIGEVGLDFWKVQGDSERQIQCDIFSRFIDLSLELDLPLNVHSRAAGRQVIELLRQRGAERVQLHAFDGKAAKAEPAVEAGYFFSIPPSVVRSEQKRKLVRRVPLDYLLLETDSPVLGPTAEQRNEPANIRVALAAVAEIKRLDEEEVAAAVWRNTLRLYGDRLAVSGS